MEKHLTTNQKIVGSSPTVDIKYIMKLTNNESITENINKLDDARNGLRQAYMIAAKHNDTVAMKCMKSHFNNINNHLGSIGKETFDLVDLENVHTVSDLIDL